MEYKRFDDTVVLRLDRNDEITESLISVCASENIRAASFDGIGATDDFEVGIFDLEKQGYNRFTYNEGNHEITSLEGNISFFEGKPYVHAHITCADRNGKIIGGHLFRANISLTCEIYIDVANGEVGRKFDPEIGINRLDF